MPRLEGCPCSDNKANRTAAGNCRAGDAPDGLPIQCVGRWSMHKHYYLAQYIEATREVRSRFLEPRGRGGAAFIDLFAGPGLACDRHTGDIIDGSPLIALGHTAAPFSRLIFCEIDPDNVRALTERTADDAERVRIVPGDCNETITDIIELIPEYGLNIALIDPFAPRALRWDTIRALARVTRMDFIIHFPTGPIKRNFGRGTSDRRIDEMVGTDAWRADVRGARDVSKLIDHLRSSLVALGYTHEQVRSLQIMNSRNLPIYHLVYASRHNRGNAIWQSIARRTPDGQGELGFR